MLYLLRTCSNKLFEGTLCVNFAAKQKGLVIKFVPHSDITWCRTRSEFWFLLFTCCKGWIWSLVTSPYGHCMLLFSSIALGFWSFPSTFFLPLPFLGCFLENPPIMAVFFHSPSLHCLYTGSLSWYSRTPVTYIVVVLSELPSPNHINFVPVGTTQESTTFPFSFPETVAYPGGFSGCLEPPPPHIFFNYGGEALTGTELHLPLKFATLGNPP